MGNAERGSKGPRQVLFSFPGILITLVLFCQHYIKGWDLNNQAHIINLQLKLQL